MGARARSTNRERDREIEKHTHTYTERGLMNVCSPLFYKQKPRGTINGRIHLKFFHDYDNFKLSTYLTLCCYFLNLKHSKLFRPLNLFPHKCIIIFFILCSCYNLFTTSNVISFHFEKQNEVRCGSTFL